MELPAKGVSCGAFEHALGKNRNFVELVHDSNEQCLICLVDESEQGHQWDRYKLSCGHQYHTRCYRLWVNDIGKYKCTLCGDIDMDDHTKQFCTECKEWGHGLDDRLFFCTKKTPYNKENKEFYMMMELLAHR